MRRAPLLAAVLGVSALPLLPARGVAQLPPKARWTVPANNLGIEAGPGIAFGLSYARRLGDRRLMLGGAVGYAFEENANSFDRNIWDTIVVEGFIRFLPNDVIHGEAGLSVLAFSPEDDTDLRGTFLGLYTALMVGYRFVFVGSEFRLGVAGVEGSSEGGVIVSPRVRAVIPWGR